MLDNYGRPRSDFTTMLSNLSDPDFLKKAKETIWLSAYANNNPRSDYHWQADACYDEAQRRGKPRLYRQAYRETVKEATGRDPYPDDDEEGDDLN